MLNEFNRNGGSENFNDGSSNPLANGIPDDAVWNPVALEYEKETDPDTNQLRYVQSGVTWFAQLD